MARAEGIRARAGEGCFYSSNKRPLTRLASLGTLSLKASRGEGGTRCAGVPPLMPRIRCVAFSDFGPAKAPPARCREARARPHLRPSRARGSGAPDGARDFGAAPCDAVRPESVRPHAFRRSTGDVLKDPGPRFHMFGSVVLRGAPVKSVSRLPLRLLAPLNASDHTIDFTCGTCGTVLMYAEEGQVHNVTIRCARCGSCNSTNA